MKTFTIANKQNNLLEVFSNLLLSSTLADDLLEQKISPWVRLKHFQRSIHDIFKTIEGLQISSHSFDFFLERHKLKHEVF